MREKPLTPWVVAECTGKILAAHCDCVAGLGETCSHVASLLFAIESGVRIRDSMTVMQKNMERRSGQKYLFSICVLKS